MTGMTPVEVIVHRILVVDSDRENTDSLKSCLEQNKYDVEVARDAGQAHSAFSMHLPDFVIVELMLPNDVTGFEVCEKMKRDNDGVPVMVLSEIEMDDARDLARRVGADGYMTKPYDPDELLENIRQIAETVWARKHLGDDARNKREKVRFTCLECGKHLKVSGAHRGRTLNCPRCGQPVIVPHHD